MVPQDYAKNNVKQVYHAWDLLTDALRPVFEGMDDEMLAFFSDRVDAGAWFNRTAFQVLDERE
jgi:hypothetical protein